jgi:hypothetical protein
MKVCVTMTAEAVCDFGKWSQLMRHASFLLLVWILYTLEYSPEHPPNIHRKIHRIFTEKSTEYSMEASTDCELINSKRRDCRVASKELPQ